MKISNLTNLTTIIKGSSLSEENDLRCVSWNVLFNVTAELEVKVDKKFHSICYEYNRPMSMRKGFVEKSLDWLIGWQTVEERCTADENCEYKKISGFCIKRKQKKAERTYKLYSSVQRTLDVRNLTFIVSDDSSELQLKAENIQCLDWDYSMGNSLKFTVYKTINHIKYN